MKKTKGTRQVYIKVVGWKNIWLIKLSITSTPTENLEQFQMDKNYLMDVSFS